MTFNYKSPFSIDALAGVGAISFSTDRCVGRVGAISFSTHQCVGRAGAISFSLSLRERVGVRVKHD